MRWNNYRRFVMGDEVDSIEYHQIKKSRFFCTLKFRPVTVHVLFVRSKMSWNQTTRAMIIHLHHFLFLVSCFFLN